MDITLKGSKTLVDFINNIEVVKLQTKKNERKFNRKL
jgi:hypothetical protein